MTSLSHPKAALLPPPTQTSNFENPESLSKWNIVCTSVILSITTILLILRTYVRLGIKKEWVLEDYMCCLSWAFLVALCALITTLMHKHGGIHGWDLTIPQVRQATYWFNIATIIYAPAILSTKLAILLLYRRVFSPHRRGAFDFAIRVLTVILCGFYLATTLVKIWECTPRERIWNKSVPGKCVNVNILISASGLFNTVTDVIILLMPIKGVWDLKMAYKRKIGVVLVFTVGFIAPSFSIVGVVVRFRANGSPDMVFNQASILLWAAAEVSTGVICVCSPPLAVLTHGQGPRLPTQSIMNGESSSRTGDLSCRRRPTSTDEELLFGRGHMELQHRDTRMPASSVVTGIVGGVDSDKNQACGFEIHQSRVSDHEAVPAGEDHIAGIMKTVRMEQTYL